MDSREIRIGRWRLQPELNRLIGDDGPVPLEPKVADLLAELAAEPGRVVSRSELRERVWGEVHVGEDALNRVVSLARRALGDDPNRPEYIETVPRRGYRLIAVVEKIGPRPEESQDAAPQPFRATRAAALGLVVVLTLAGVWWLQPQPAAGFDVIPLTTFPGEERSPALSPDGERLAFLWNGGSGSQLDLYVKPLDGEVATRLTRDPAAKSPPVWSPDGSRIGFGRRTTGGGEICLVRPDGAQEPDCVAGVASERLPRFDWTPDGLSLVISERTGSGGPYALVRLDLETGGRQRLTEPPPESLGDQLPALSVDGRRVLFLRAESPFRADLHVVDAETLLVRRVTFDASNITGADWDPTRPDRIVFSSNREGLYELWEVSVTGTPPRKMLDSETRAFDVASFPGGDRFAYAQWHVDANIWRIPAGSRPHDEAPVVVSSRQEGNPAVSPDGSLLAFVSDRSGEFQLWVSAADGTEPRQLTDGARQAVSWPRWSPHGRSLIAAVRKEGSRWIERIDLEGGREVLFEDGSECGAPAWAADERAFYFASDRSGRWQIFRQAVGASNEPVPVTEGFASMEEPAGEWLYFTKRYQDGLWRRPVSGGPEERVLDDLQAEDWANWQVTASGVWYVGAGGAGGRSVRFLDLSTGAPREVADAQWVPYSSGLAVSAEGSVYVARVDRSESDLMMLVQR